MLIRLYTQLGLKQSQLMFPEFFQKLIKHISKKSMHKQQNLLQNTRSYLNLENRVIVLFHKFVYRYFYLIIFYYRKDRMCPARNAKPNLTYPKPNILFHKNSPTQMTTIKLKTLYIKLRFLKLCGSLSSQKGKITDHNMQACRGFLIIISLIFNPVYIIHAVVSMYINQSIVIRTQIILYLTTAFGKCDQRSTNYFLAEPLGQIKVNVQCLRPS